VIVGANGVPVHKLSDLVDQLEKAGVGHQVEFSLRRGDRTRSVDVDVVDIGRAPS
jgi:2-alkenal reductase